jgi:hypothetical protein
LLIPTVRALWLFLIGCAPLPVGLVLVNLMVDPVRVASGDAYERGIATILLAGHGVTNIANPKDVAVVSSVVERLPRSPEVIVLGSSRSKLIRGTFFGDRSFFNNSVSGAGFIDELALYRLYRERQFAPKLVILEMSPWVFESRYASVWEDRYPPRRDLEGDILDNRPSWLRGDLGLLRSIHRLKEMVSPGYFQTSVMTWLRRKEAGPAAPPAAYMAFQPGDVPLQETQLADGSVIYAESLANESSRQHLHALAIAYARGLTWIPRAISEDRVALLEAFVRRIRRNGAEVVLYLPPYHPVAYDQMMAQREHLPLPEVERALQGIAARTGSTTIGSFDPRALGFGEDDFFDPSHPTADAIARLFATRWATATTAETTVRIAGITNPNGVETRDGRPFFWIGRGAACISLKAGASGWARLSFGAEPGPSLPATLRRRLLVSSTAPGAEPRKLLIDGAREASAVVPVAAGVTEACLTSLDEPSVAHLSNGDSRTLLVGIAAPRVEISSAEAEASEPPCHVSFGSGWYPPEVDGTTWLRWTSGAAELVISAQTPGQLRLSGKAIAMTRPDHVAINIGPRVVGGFDIPGGEWAFRPFTPQTVSVPRGETRLLLTPGHAAASQGTDTRRLAVAIQNLSVTLAGAAVPCGLDQ